MEQVAFITSTMAYPGPASRIDHSQPATIDWPASHNDADVAWLWQYLTQLQMQLSGMHRRRSGSAYKAARQQLSRVALLLIPTTTDLALASGLLNFLMPGHLASGQAHVQLLAQSASMQSLTPLDDLDERGLLHLLIAIYGDAACQSIVDYIDQKLTKLSDGRIEE